jgi:opacity protein-like surface antigen
MRPIKQFFVFIIPLFLFQSAQAASESKLTFEPLVGIETALVRFPEPARYVTRATYGARVLYGTTLLSGELEYTEAQSRKDYPDIDQKVEDKSQRASLGIRSTLALGTYLGIYGRLGGRASHGETKVTTAGVSETHDNPLQFDPYAGAGVQLAFSNNFALNAGVTLIRNNDDHYDSQYTLGLTARFGNL